MVLANPIDTHTCTAEVKLASSILALHTADSMTNE